jgi:hypothetical protein
MSLVAVLVQGLCLSLLISTAARGAMVLQQDNTRCGTAIHAEALNLWQETLRPYIAKQLIADRLLKQGDVYALYDIQTYLHNLISMARRCGDAEVIDNAAALLLPTFAAMEIDSVDGGRKWICHGGAICNEKNKLINTEVMLTSVQYLALVADIGNAISGVSPAIRSPAMSDFLTQATAITQDHLTRWGEGSFGKALATKKMAKAEDVRDGSSSLFFTDKDLWSLAISAELAGILKDGTSLHPAPVADIGRLATFASDLLSLFQSRLTLETQLTADGERQTVADLDRGFWRLFSDNRYAGYNGDERPVRCVAASQATGPGASKRLEVVLPAEKVPILSSIGWDISHAPRLVHVFDALVRNRVALQSVYGIDEKKIPDKEVKKAFANAMVKRIWNGDLTYPLFSNYWDGSNGWYRVAYDIGIDQCREGTPPYGLSDSFAWGGFASWADSSAEIGRLGQRLFTLFRSKTTSDQAFVQKYYFRFSDKASPNVRALTEVMFYPTIVGVN